MRLTRADAGRGLARGAAGTQDGWPHALRGKLVQPQATHAVQPGMPLLVILRDPATRAASQYGNDCHPCHLPLPEDRRASLSAPPGRPAAALRRARRTSGRSPF